MPYNPTIHHRRSIRLQEWDYSWPWWYYVTIVVNQRRTILGDIVDDMMQLSPLGEIVRDTWLGIPKRYRGAELDDYIVMPNHFHGTIIINDQPVGAIMSKIPPLAGNRPYERLGKESTLNNVDR